MRQQLSLFLTTSFLFLSQGVQGSTINNDDNNPVSQGNAPAVVLAQTDEPLQCYYTVRGVRKPLFAQDGKLLDQRAQEANSATMSFVEKDGKLLWTNVLSSLAHYVRVEILEFLQDDSRGQLNLMHVSHGFRGLALVLPERSNNTACTGNALKKHLLTALIGGQTGDLDLFIKDQLKTFQKLSLPDLQDAFASRHYAETLSPKTEHGNTYRSIGKENIRGVFSGQLYVTLPRGLRLVPLNFPEALTIRSLTLSDKQLKILPDLSHLTNLQRLDLSNSQMKVLPDLSHLTNLTCLSLSDNQLTVVPDLSYLTKLEWLNLEHNQLKGLPDLSHLTKLEWLNFKNNQLTVVPDLSKLKMLHNLYLDAPLCQDATVLEVLRMLNRSRVDWNKVKLIACSKDPQGNDVQEEVPLD